MSTRSTIIIEQSGLQDFIYHHCDGYFKGVGKELLNVIIPLYMNNHNTFHISGMTECIKCYSDEYEESDNIAGDIEYLYIIKIIDPLNILFTCIDVPLFSEYDYKTLSNCDEIFKAYIKFNDGIEIEVNVPEYVPTVYNQQKETQTDIFNELNTSMEINKYDITKEILVNKIVEANYKSNMSKDDLRELLKNFYDMIEIQNKLHI